MSTKSENLFTRFCEQVSIQCQRVQESQESRPDFELRIGDSRILVEVKQFDPTPEEKEAAIRFENGEQVGFEAKPGERIRRVVRKANYQFKAMLANHPSPAILVVYNNTPCSLHTDPYSVRTAMRGLDYVEVNVPANPSEPPQFGSYKSGQGNTMREGVNTSTSAVCVLTESGVGELCLAVFHNPHAVNPLAYEDLRFSGVLQFKVPERSTNSLDESWVEV